MDNEEVETERDEEEEEEEEGGREGTAWTRIVCLPA